ncbi:hypothetical protein ACHAPT_009849 [Fusarium lateritium]
MRFKTQNTYPRPHRFNTLTYSSLRDMDSQSYNHWVVAGFIILHFALLGWILSVSISLQRDRQARIIGRRQLTQRPFRTKPIEFPWNDALRETEELAVDDSAVREPLLPTSLQGTGNRRMSWKHKNEWGE